MERPGDEPPGTEPGIIEEEETTETVEPERLDGQRILMCAVPFFVGAGCVVVGFAVASDEALKIIVVVGGIGLMLAAFVGAITKGFKVEASKERFRVDGEIPRGHTKTTIKTTKVQRLTVSKSLVAGRAPPKTGIMPPTSGPMPPKRQAGLLEPPKDGADGKTPSAVSTHDSARAQPEGTSPDHPSSATP